MYSNRERKGRRKKKAQKKPLYYYQDLKARPLAPEPSMLSSRPQHATKVRERCLDLGCVTKTEH